MKKTIKGYIAGILTMLLLSGTVLIASPVARDIVFGIRVSVDGEVIQFEDDMRPFIMEGRTFLPVRAIADIAGFDVDFDGAENMVILTTEGVGAVAVQPTPAPTPTPTPAPTPAPQSNLAGTWNYLGTPFYILNADGTGMLSDLFELRWWSGNGIFSYCLTPIICGNNCFFPLEWYYTLNGNDLTLTNVLDSSETYRYVRR